MSALDTGCDYKTYYTSQSRLSTLEPDMEEALEKLDELKQRRLTNQDAVKSASREQERKLAETVDKEMHLANLMGRESAMRAAFKQSAKKERQQQATLEALQEKHSEVKMAFSKDLSKFNSTFGFFRPPHQLPDQAAQGKLQEELRQLRDWEASKMADIDALKEQQTKIKTLEEKHSTLQQQYEDLQKETEELESKKMEEEKEMGDVLRKMSLHFFQKKEENETLAKEVNILQITSANEKFRCQTLGRKLNALTQAQRALNSALAGSNMAAQAIAAET